MINYSAVIRSTGYNEFLQQLLESLANQSLPPKEVVIVLPHGIPSWENRFGARFIHSRKGMISQRAEGIKAASEPNLLLLDDDIVFKDFQAVERLFSEMLRYNAVLALPYSPDAFPQGKLRKLFYALFGIAVPTSKRYLGYTAGGGFYYPKNPSFEQPYEVEGGYGRCIAANRDFLLKNQLLGDPDLEKISYALRDDGAFVLDVVRHGGKAILVGNVPYEHLGAVRKLSLQRLHHSFEASVFNNYIFWRKYIKGRYRMQIVPIVGFAWHLTGIFILALLSCLRHKSIMPLLGVVRGFTRMVQEWL